MLPNKRPLMSTTTDYTVGRWITTRISTSLELRMKFKTLFMSDEEKHGHNFNFFTLFNVSKQFLVHEGLRAECV